MRFPWLINRTNNESMGLGKIFQFDFIESEFNHVDICTTYKKILTDTLDKVRGIDNLTSMLFDSCVMNREQEGLISMLADAMARKAELFLVYEKNIDVLRKANSQEESQIRKDYEKKTSSTIGTYINFKNYSRTDLLKVFSSFEFYTLGNLHKLLKISEALGLKLEGMRRDIGESDSDLAAEQAREIVKAITSGQGFMIDAGDSIELPSPSVDSTKETINFINQKRAYILDMPTSYIDGEQTSGIGSTGEQDTRAVERGLKIYFNTILKPVIEEVFKIDVSFMTQDFRNLETVTSTLSTFSAVKGDKILSQETMIKIICSLLNIPFEDEKKLIDAQPEEEKNYFNPFEM